MDSFQSFQVVAKLRSIWSKILSYSQQQGLKDYFCGIARRLLPYSIACTIQEHKVARRLSVTNAATTNYAYDISALRILDGTEDGQVVTPAPATLEALKSEFSTGAEASLVTNTSDDNLPGFVSGELLAIHETTTAVMSASSTGGPMIESFAGIGAHLKNLGIPFWVFAIGAVVVVLAVLFGFGSIPYCVYKAKKNRKKQYHTTVVAPR